MSSTETAVKKRQLPFLEWGRHYTRATLSADLLAAVIVTIMLIPQSLAYAMLAGLPPEAGLYASIAPLLVYGVLGSSRVLAVGPVAVVSLMTATAIGDLAASGSAAYWSAAITLALLSGLVLLLMGVLLHDIGKIRELAWDPALVYTDEGQLLGHIHLGMEILNEKLVQAEQRLGRALDAEKILRLKHMIISHHGTREFGSPAVPMTPEAMTLNCIDTLDSKLHEFTRTITEDMNTDSAWTPFNPRMDRRLFKGLPKHG